MRVRGECSVGTKSSQHVRRRGSSFPTLRSRTGIARAIHVRSPSKDTSARTLPPSTTTLHHLLKAGQDRPPIDYAIAAGAASARLILLILQALCAVPSHQRRSVRRGCTLWAHRTERSLLQTSLRPLTSLHAKTTLPTTTSQHAVHALQTAHDSHDESDQRSWIMSVTSYRRRCRACATLAAVVS